MHHCECSHKRLKFCTRCQAPYCLDCRREWRFEACTRQHAWSWAQYSPWVPVSTTLSLSNATQTVSVDDATLCTHQA